MHAEAEATQTHAGQARGAAAMSGMPEPYEWEASSHPCDSGENERPIRLLDTDEIKAVVERLMRELDIEQACHAIVNGP
jgi:hypothetical protein